MKENDLISGRYTHAPQDIAGPIEQQELITALKDSEARYRALVEGLNTPLYTTDAKGIITMYNKAAADLWGREPQVGRDMWCGSYKIRNTDGSDLPLGDCPMAICLKEGRAVTDQEIIVVRPDGTERLVAPQPQPIFDEHGKMTGAINMLIDVTDIKRTEQALRKSEHDYQELVASLEKMVEEKATDLKKKNDELKKSEERYHKMVDEVEDYAILLLNPEGVIQNWNKGAEKIKGYREEEIVGKSFELFYTPEDREKNLPANLIGEARQKGKAVIEGWRVKKDGGRFWGSTVLTALHDEMGGIIGFSKVTRDLTERKLAEDKMRLYSNDLEFQNKELEQFVYAASHDLKEPLRKVHLYNSYVYDNAASLLDERSKDYMERSLTAIKRMGNLIEDLLAYSKITYSAITFTKVDLNTLLAEIIAEKSEELEQNNITIEKAALPVINGISFQCKQLLDNLVSNSIKYRHPGRPGHIRIGAAIVYGPQMHDGKAGDMKKYHKISIEDNGIGFEPEYAEKIFKIFQRLHNQAGASGSGIGLAIAKRIIQNHKGFITATGKIDEGARFDVYFPA